MTQTRGGVGGGAVTYREIRAGDALACVAGLTDVLADCVAGGSSIGFVLPLERERLERFWHSIAGMLEAGSRRLIVAERDGEIVGTVQLIVELPENQPHRAEVAKMLVRRDARRSGLGRELMLCAERLALELGKTLLVLDTANPGAERLYASLGWIRVGAIPRFALMPDGSDTETVVMYRDLAS